MSKLSMTTDSTMDIVIKMSEGNPGAMATMMELIKETEKDIGNMSVIFFIDTLELYGSRLYQLWNDCCNRDISKVIEVVNSCMGGKISREEFFHHIDQPRGIPF